MQGRPLAHLIALAIIVVGLACVLQVTGALAAGPEDINRRSDQEVIAAIIKCTIAGKEAVLLREEVRCAPFRSGSDLLREQR
jgi:hypothetical protein